MDGESFETCPLAAALADSVRGARTELTSRWLERISARVSINAHGIFPTEELLDHVPLLMDGIASYIEDPVREITAEVPVVAKAMELGALRHRQGFDAYEILKEYEILGGILFAHVVREVEVIPLDCTRAELMTCAQRLFRAVAVIQQTTLTQYLDLANSQVHDREQRLRAFNRALSHEFKNRIGAVLGAADLLLSLDDMEPSQRERFVRMVLRNAREMQATLESLLDLSRLEGDQRRQRHIELPQATKEVMRRLRDAAEASAVKVSVQGELPGVEVNAAAVELVLTNYVSNAIKYSDPTKSDRWVKIQGAIEFENGGDPCRVVVRVADNGLGVPAQARAQLFQRFFRVNDGKASAVEGTGVGLSIVRETVDAMGGNAWAEFPSEGSVFAFSIPCRRSEDSGPEGERPTERGRSLGSAETFASGPQLPH